MSNGLVERGSLEDIADAIRGKLSVQTQYKPGQMAAAIGSIPTGTTPTGTINITENGDVDVTDYATAHVSVSPNLQSKTATENGTVTPDSGYDGLSSVVVNVSGGGGDLPSDYTELQYLTIGTSTTYVGVPFIQMKGDRLITKASCDWTQSSTIAFGGLKTSFGQTDGYRGNWHVVSSRKQIWCNGGLVEYVTSDPTITASGGASVLYGPTLSANEVCDIDITFNSNASAAVMYLYHGAYASNQNIKNANLYGAKIIHSNGANAINLVPCSRNSDSVCGFFDLCSNKFFTALSGSFSPGPAVT